MRQISQTLILFFYFMFVYFLGILYSPPFKKYIDSINKDFIVIIFIILVLSILFVMFVPLIMSLPFKKFIDKYQKFFIGFFPLLPVFLSTFGFFIYFIGIILKNLDIALFGMIIFQFGVLSWFIMFYIKLYLESQISYTINEANRNMSTINPNDPQQIKQFIRFINLTLNNINSKFERKIKLNISESGIYQLETLLDCLPYYIKMAGTREMDKLKDHIERMANSVNSDNTVRFNIFTNELIQLSKETIKLFRDNNLKIIYRTSSLKFLMDMENIKSLSSSLTSLGYLIILILFIYGKLSLSDVNQISPP